MHRLSVLATLDYMHGTFSACVEEHLNSYSENRNYRSFQTSKDMS